MHRYKSSPVTVFTWSGQPYPEWPEWVKDVAMFYAPPVVGDVPGIIIRDNDSAAWIMKNGESLIQILPDRIFSLTAAEFEAQIESVLDPTPVPPSGPPGPGEPGPTPSPVPTPSPAGTWPAQPFDPIDHVTIDGIEYVRYYASPKGGGGILKMPVVTWKLLKPTITTGLH